MGAVERGEQWVFRCGGDDGQVAGEAGASQELGGTGLDTGEYEPAALGGEGRYGRESRAEQDWTAPHGGACVLRTSG